MLVQCPVKLVAQANSEFCEQGERNGFTSERQTITLCSSQPLRYHNVLRVEADTEAWDCSSSTLHKLRRPTASSIRSYIWRCRLIRRRTFVALLAVLSERAGPVASRIRVLWLARQFLPYFRLRHRLRKGRVGCGCRCGKFQCRSKLVVVFWYTGGHYCYS